MPIVVDTGVLFALFDRSDRWHERARGFLATHRELLLVPATVLPETAYLLRQLGGPARERLVVAAVASGELTVEDLSRPDAARALELMAAHPEIGFVDASVVAIAERLKITRLFTTDRRHFASVRPRHVEAFALLP
jgi:hypothetical protein